MSKAVTTTSSAQDRTVSINGTPGAKFEFFIKQGTSFYNFNSNLFQSSEFLLKNQEIPSSGRFTVDISLPKVTTETTYDIFVRPIGETDIAIQRTSSLKAGTITQKGTPNAITFNTVEGSGSTFTIASSLSGNKITRTNKLLTYTGAITNAGGGSLFTYVNKVPTIADFTNLGTTISATIQAVNQVDDSGTPRTQLFFEPPDDLSSVTTGQTIDFGETISDVAITVQAITVNSDDTAVVTTSSEVPVSGGTATFTSSGYEISTFNVSVSGSGTTSTTLTVNAEASKLGTSDATSQLDVDDFMTDTPNAFPITLNVPVGTPTEINVLEQCTNFLGTFGDIDSNAGTKTYKAHSLPAHTTSSIGVSGDAATFGTITQSNGAAISAGNTLTNGIVVFTPAELAEPGDTDSFVYKCTDAQSSPKDSSTTQGLVSITIVG
tara:strand:+ start:2133 stop:3437 length:1305 start_codon:yes stop_codon:yes gene_type:complete